MNLEDLEIYQLSLELSDKAWDIYLRLSKQHRFNIGNQFLRSVDSIGANIAEGFGRFYYKDTIRFYYNSRGSLFESKHWVQLLFVRKLIEKEDYDKVNKKLELLGVKLNNFINSVKQLSEVYNEKQ